MKTVAIPIMLSILGGCAWDNSEPKDFIPPRDAGRSSNLFIAHQSDNGAADDATLQECHFTDGKLNSLGEKKLEAMVPADLDTHVVVYLNVRAETVDARKDTVTGFLGAHGVSESHLKVETGANARRTTPAAAGLATLSRTDSASAEGSTKEETGMTTGTEMK
jgi:hypothetical protein